MSEWVQIAPLLHLGLLIQPAVDWPEGLEMAVQGSNPVMIPAVRGVKSPVVEWKSMIQKKKVGDIHFITSNRGLRRLLALSNSKGGAPPPPVSNLNYMVPLDLPSSFSSITRPLGEILRDLNKRIPDNIIKPHETTANDHSTFISWYHANRMLSFYASGWCGEIRDVIFSDSGSVTVVYRVIVRGSDGEAHRESSGTVLFSDFQGADPVAAAEELAFCRACARFGLGLYLYHEE